MPAPLSTVDLVDCGVHPRSCSPAFAELFGEFGPGAFPSALQEVVANASGAHVVAALRALCVLGALFALDRPATAADESPVSLEAKSS